ncbi:hypothetical protein [Methanobrevibacter arboriphilus]|nr:hypothetical protein [Methanobrevibacter arboriphilus]
MKLVKTHYGPLNARTKSVKGLRVMSKKEHENLVKNARKVTIK